MNKLFILLVIISLKTFSQDFKPNNLFFETGTLISTTQFTPFWLRTNQYGTVPLQSQFLTLRVGLFKDYSTLNKNTSTQIKRFRLGYGINIISNIGKVNQLIIPEVYIKSRFKAFEFFVGRKRETLCLVDSTLSSGSYAWSGNALPLPKIQFSIPEFVSILGRGLISLKGSYAHGWFGKQDYLKGVYLHQKTLYGRIGKPDWKIKTYAGFNHQVQWGGKLNNINLLTTTKYNDLPSSFNDYLYLVSGISLNTKKQREKIKEGKYNEFDLTNRIGNHLGTIDIGAEMTIKKIKFLFYRQNIYDDGSLFYFANIKDGLSGISIKNLNTEKKKFSIQQLNVELFNSSDQAGIYGPDQTIPYIRGQDNYFNHAQFLDGWGYKGNTIGTPFIIPSNTLGSEFPKFVVNDVAEKTVLFFTNNSRVKAKIISFTGNFNNLNFTYKFSYSNNFGTYPFPFPDKTNQVSSLIYLTYPLKNKSLLLSGAISYDYGKLYPDSQAIMIIIRKTWI